MSVAHLILESWLFKQMTAASVSPVGLVCSAPVVQGKFVERVQVAIKTLPWGSVVMSPR